MMGGDLAPALADLARFASVWADERATTRKQLVQAVARAARAVDALMDGETKVLPLGLPVVYADVKVTWWVEIGSGPPVLHSRGGWVLLRDGRSLFSPRVGEERDGGWWLPAEGPVRTGLVAWEHRDWPVPPTIPAASLEAKAAFAEEVELLVELLQSEMGAEG